MLNANDENFTVNSLNIQKSLKSVFKDHPEIPKIVMEIEKQKGKAYLVGGSVRDLFLSNEISDIDIEIHFLSLEQLSSLLSQFGNVNYVGKSFGILKLDYSKVDWSLPRTDRGGRKPVVSINPYLDIVEALKRRDLTINAMAIDLSSYQLIDPFNGINDLRDKILRSPDLSFFSEDPLRFYRVMQFIPRFCFFPDEKLNKICSGMDISEVSVERIEAEFKKMFLKSKNPSLGIRWLDKIGRLKQILPEIYETKFTKQDLIWHPEGYVFEHLMQALDASAVLDYDSEDEKLIIMYSALAHDIGKVSTTKIIDGRIRSPGHAEAGFSLSKKLLKRVMRNKNIIDTASLLIKYHMLITQFVEAHSSLAAYRRLALKLKGYANLKMLCLLGLADRRGRNGKSCQPLTANYEDLNEFEKNAKDAGVFENALEPILKGRDIADLVKPGLQMGELLKYAYKIQISQGIMDKNKLKERVIKKLELKK